MPQTNAHIKAKSASPAAARSITLPCADEAKDLSHPPVMPDPPKYAGRSPKRE